MQKGGLKENQLVRRGRFRLLAAFSSWLSAAPPAVRESRNDARIMGTPYAQPFFPLLGSSSRLVVPLLRQLQANKNAKAAGEAAFDCKEK